jgi:hypothetical protein
MKYAWKAWSANGYAPDSSSRRDKRSTGKRTSTTSEAPRGLPPGSYTRETLPPPRPEVQAILDRVNVKAQELQRQRNGGAPPVSKKTANRNIAVADRGKRRISPADKGKRQIDLT